MYSTEKNTIQAIPTTNEAAVVGRYLLYPDRTGKRVMEGGLRTQGLYKQSLPELPLVTIITVCLNSEKTLEQCIQSVLQQTYENIEYIIIDGASTDHTLNLIRNYEMAIDYFVSEPDRGLYHAMNKGLELASGDYILILNSDDWYVSDCIQSLLMAREYSCTSFVSALAQAVDKDDNPLTIMRSQPYDDSIRIRMSLRHETMLLARSLYNDTGYYNENFPIIGDLDFTIRLFQAGYTNYEVPRPLLFFRNTGVSNTNTSGIIKERVLLYKKQFDFLSNNELMLLANRETHTGKELLGLANKYHYKKELIKALQAYVRDHMQFSPKPQWRKSKHELISFLGQLSQMHSPKISVILPVFNGEKTLRQCMDSVLSQTLKDLELICINDVSPDNSQDIINSYRELDFRVVSLTNHVNIGLGATRNRGVREARGAYVFHIDPDDTIPSKALETLYSYATKHDSELVKGAYLREQYHGNISASAKQEVRSFLKDSTPIINANVHDIPELLMIPEGHWTFLYRIDLAKRVPYPSNLKMGQDAIFLVSVLLQARTITIIRDVVYHYLANPSSTMNEFKFRKYIDVLEWRRRAWHLLRDSGMKEIADKIIRSYQTVHWHDLYFMKYADTYDDLQLETLFTSIRTTFQETGIISISHELPEHLRTFFQSIIDGKDEKAKSAMLDRIEQLRQKNTGSDYSMPKPNNKNIPLMSSSNIISGINAQKRSWNEKLIAQGVATSPIRKQELPPKINVATSGTVDHRGDYKDAQRGVEMKHTFSTKKNITYIKPLTNSNAVCGQFILYSDKTNLRKVEGGLRTQGKFKQSINPKQPLISIITVSFNSQETIEQSIKSVLNQTYENIEYTIIDGGSSDNTVNIIKNYDECIDYYISEPDSGLYYAMNKGLSLASGEYILFLNSDDWYVSDCVEKLLHAKVNSGADFSCGLAKYVDGNGNELYTLEHMEFDSQIRLRMPLCHELMLVSKNIYNHIGGYDERYRIIADLEFTIRLFEANYALFEVNEALLYFRNNGVSGTKTDSLINERSLLLSQQFSFLKSHEINHLSSNNLDFNFIENLISEYSDKTRLIKSLCDLSKRIFPEKLKSSHIYAKLPKISLIIAIYNAEETLRRCLDSVLLQSFTDYEVLCVNDCSPDNSQKIINEYVAKDTRIVSIINPSNCGLGQTRNRGVRNARGTYIFHLDPDDVIPVNALKNLYTCAVNNDSDIVKGRFNKVDTNLNKLSINPAISKDIIFNTNLNETKELLKSTEGHWSCLYKKELSQQICYPVDLKMGQDSLYLVRAYVKAEKISIINDTVYYYVINPSSTMNNYTLRKLMDECVWKIRVYECLKVNEDFKSISTFFIQRYWNDEVIRKIPKLLSKEDCYKFFKAFREMLIVTGTLPLNSIERNFFSQFSALVHSSNFSEAYNLLNNSKKIVVLSSSSSGGAGIAAMRFFDALKLVNSNSCLFHTINTLGNYRTQIKAQEQIRADNRTNTLFTFEEKNHLNTIYSKLIDATKDADVINIHWVSGFLSTNELDDLCNSNKLIIITLHDYHHFTGGCHYPAGCTGFVSMECHDCPQIKHNKEFKDQVHSIYLEKKRYLNRDNVYITSPSQFILDEAIRALPDKPLEKFKVIRNVFSPSLSTSKLLEKPLYSYVFICGSLKERRKGINLAIAALKEALTNNTSFSKKITLTVIGGSNELPNMEVLKNLVNLKYLGKIDDMKQIEDIFSKNQFIIQPSFEDNWPNVLVEAGAYGCIPITLPRHGCAEFAIKAGAQDFVAKSVSVRQYSNVISYSLKQDKNTLLAISESVSNFSREAHSLKDVSACFYNFFNPLFNKINENDFLLVADRDQKKNSINILNSSLLGINHNIKNQLINRQSFVFSHNYLRYLIFPINNFLQKNDVVIKLTPLHFPFEIENNKAEILWVVKKNGMNASFSQRYSATEGAFIIQLERKSNLFVLVYSDGEISYKYGYQEFLCSIEFI